MISAGTALQEFAKQCGMPIVFLSRLTEDFPGRALNAHYTIAGALATLLSYSHFPFRVIDLKTIEIRL